MRDIALVGNPNVGKTSFFNLLTKGNEHTGNWSGKTVGIKRGNFFYKNFNYEVTDLPGIYSLNGSSFEEKIAIDYIKSYDKTIFLFIDGTNIKKGLFLYFEIKKYTNNIVLVITMKDIIEKNGVIIDIEKLEKILGSDVFLVDATSEIDTEKIFEKIENSVPLKMIDKRYVEFYNERKFGYIHGVCDQIAYEVTNKAYEPNEKIKIIDKVILNRYFGVPVLIVLFLIIFGFVISFCGVLQQYLFNSFSIVIKCLYNICGNIGISDFWINILVDGGLSTALFVVSVMLPTVIVFFPLFALLEETGIIPRIIFNLDGIFSKFGLSGKNAIPMMLGFGCNCVGVTSARIFENEKKRRIAILTNNFIPCSGRTPMIFILTATYLTNNVIDAIFVMIFFILFSFIIMLLVAFVSEKILKPEQNTVIYELPFYKMPKIILLVKNSILTKALPVLCTSIYFSFIAGLLVAYLKNIEIFDTTVILLIGNMLEPIGVLMGLSGIILLAFIIGSAANEIVLPLVFLLYANKSVFSNSSLTLEDYGFGIITAICMIMFSLVHFPCFATLMTIKKETNSTYFTVICALVPLIIGIILCVTINFILQNLQIALFF